VRKLLQRLSGFHLTDEKAAGAENSAFFSTLFQERNEDGQLLSTWETRATQVHAEPCERSRGVELLKRLLRDDRHLAALSGQDLERLCGFLEFARVPANQEVIGQDEQGDYLVIVLDGTLAVDRVQPWGGRARLAEAHAGDMLGEMSLLDAGARFSACTTLTPALLAVLEARRLDELVARHPRLALALMGSLSRRLSLRLRQVSARLSALLSRS
jgi:CRP-like cAMP-binding protein